MRGGGGWLGYLTSAPLIALVTNWVAVPIFLILILFGLLVTTATPLNVAGAKVLALFRGASSLAQGQLEARRERRALEDDFEIHENPPFESPVIAYQESEPELEAPTEIVSEIDGDAGDAGAQTQLLTSTTSGITTPPIPAPVAIPALSSAEQLELAEMLDYQLPAADLLRSSPAAKGSLRPI
jgi:S-DNA-T family DNA segregation ATPase FtsK/SpoIIIE